MAGDKIAEVCVTVYEAKVSHCRLEWSYAVKYITAVHRFQKVCRNFNHIKV